MSLLYNIQSYDDYDDFAESVTWDLELKPLSLGKFQADLIFFGDADIQIGEIFYNKRLLQRGSVPPGFTFAIYHPNSAPITWRHLDFPANGIIVFPENREHHGISEPNHHPFTVTISELFLITVVEELGFPELHRFVTKGEVLMCDPFLIDRIQTFLTSLCTVLKCRGGEFINTLISHEVKWEITRLLLYALASSKKKTSKKRQFFRRKKVVDRVLDYIDSDMTSPPTIRELCKIAEVGERTLRNIFYEQFHLSPKKFILSHRLNAVRSELKRIDNSEVLISKIANVHGFWHMGQFAKDYKKLFAELPSTTRQNSRSKKGRSTTSFSHDSLPVETV